MISQIEMIAAVCRELDRQGVKSLCSRQYNAIIESVNEMILECERVPVMTSEGMGLKRWLASDDTGASSCYMAGVLGGFDRPYANPYDLDDFGRCSRLLTAVPEFRDRLEVMRDKSRQWSSLLDVWSKVEALTAEQKHIEANRIVMEAVSRSTE